MASSVQNLGILIEAKTSGEQDVKSLESRINSLFQRAEQAGQKISTAGKGEDFAKSFRQFVEAPLSSAQGLVEGFASKLGPIGIGATAITVGLSGLAAVSLNSARSLADLSDQLEDAGARFGVSASRAAELRAALTLTGGSFEKVDGLAGRLSATISNLPGDEGLRNLQAMNVQLRDTEGNIRPVLDVMVDLGQGLAAIDSAAERNARAMSILGRGAADVVPDLTELAKRIEEVRVKGLAPTDDQIAGWSKYREELAQTDLLVSRFTADLKDALAFAVAIPTAGAIQRALSTRVAPGGEDGKVLDIEAYRKNGLAMESLGQGTLKRLEELGIRSGSSLARKFADGLLASKDGIDAALSRTREGLSKLRVEISQLEASNAGPSVVQKKIEEYQKLTKQAAGFEAELKAIAEAERKADELRKRGTFVITFDSQISSPLRRPAPTLFNRSERQQPGDFILPSDELLGDQGRLQQFRQRFPFALSDQDVETTRKFADAWERVARTNFDSFNAALKEAAANDEQRLQRLEQNRQRQADSIQREADFQIAARRAIAGPGDEVNLINQAAELRIRAAERELELFRGTRQEREALIKFELAADEAKKQRALDLLSIDKQRREQFRNTVGSLFDAGVAGGEGIKSFFGSIIRSNARIAAQNAGELIFSNVAGKLALPGQGTAENPTALGRILSGTIFQRNPLEGQLDINTVATQANTAATAALTRVMSGLDAGGGAGSIVLPGGLSIPSGVFQGAGRGGLIYSLGQGASTAQSLFSSFSSGVRDPFNGRVPESVRASARADYYRDVLGIDPGIQAAARADSGNLAKGLGVVASLGAAGVGIAAGVREGGLRGATTATASGLGGLASILTIAGVSGPAAPIVAGAALGLTYARLLFPDPKKQREDFINAQIDAARFQAPAATSYGVGVDGFGVDTNKAGATRPIIVNINTLDARSFMDRKNEVADAVRFAIQEGHAINGEMREALA